KVAIQHHHAHIASCMAENGIHERVIGIAWDGTGYGADGQIWGGEFLVCDFGGFRRAAHFRYVPLVGGDRAARQGWRTAAAYLYEAFGGDYERAAGLIRDAASPAWWKTFDRLLANPPIRTSSCGRLFDAVAALTGVCRESSFEGEAAMLLEAAARGDADVEAYPFGFVAGVIDTAPMIRRIVEEYGAGVDRGAIAAAFHRTMAEIMKTVSIRLRGETGLNRICLSGGTFQNATLLSHALPLLRAAGFEVFQHSGVPANDGGLSLGQAVIASRHWKAKS
ncbi:MAG: carbamoyltransferase HypF, partial [Acidobacteriota bacterium]|nr:carbamoyltransferase HypF [Acidobacteriota bacterium]